MKYLFFIIFIIVIASLSDNCCCNAQQQDKIIEILEYGNEFCTGGALVNTQATAGKCYSGEYASGSGIMNCILLPSNSNSNNTIWPYKCVQLHEFSDDSCSQRTAIRDRVCSTCMGEKTGKHTEVVCTETHLLIRSHCDGDFSTNKTVCTNCANSTIVPPKTCTRISSDRFVLVTEVTHCPQGVINVQDFSDSTDCSKTASMSEYLMPNDNCEGGVKYICKP